MPGRSKILNKIRTAMGVRDDDDRKNSVLQRLQDAPIGLIPERGKVDSATLITLFCDKANNVKATTTRVTNKDAIPEALSRYLRDHNLPQELRMGDDLRLGDIDWSKTPNLTTHKGPSDGSDLVGLSYAYGGVAETGTLVMTSGKDNPTTLNFLPESHIVIINAKDIAGDYETVLARISEKYGKNKMPRTVNMITGPSLSGDIERTLLHGAHGPRSLHIFVVEE